MDKQNDIYAFPVAGSNAHGMTLADFIAIHAMVHMISDGMSPDYVAAKAYRYADAMLTERTRIIKEQSLTERTRIIKEQS